jgi:hypothetical protein
MPRTTVTLDPDVEALLRRRMRERKVSFKQALNDAVREASTAKVPGRAPFSTVTARLGLPVVNLDRALRLAAELEDEELVRRMRLGK